MQPASYHCYPAIPQAIPHAIPHCFTNTSTNNKPSPHHLHDHGLPLPLPPAPPLVHLCHAPVHDLAADLRTDIPMSTTARVSSSITSRRMPVVHPTMTCQDCNTCVKAFRMHLLGLMM